MTGGALRSIVEYGVRSTCFLSACLILGYAIADFVRLQVSLIGSFGQPWGDVWDIVVLPLMFATFVLSARPAKFATSFFYLFAITASILFFTVAFEVDQRWCEYRAFAVAYESGQLPDPDANIYDGPCSGVRHSDVYMAVLWTWLLSSLILLIRGLGVRLMSNRASAE